VNVIERDALSLVRSLHIATASIASHWILCSLIRLKSERDQ
jgi:hypothetical protein